MPEVADTDSDVVVIGAGASATMFVTALSRVSPGVSVTVVDPSPRPGPGVPYRTPEPWHRMNVRADQLSADPTDPHHFVTWLAETPSANLPLRKAGSTDSGASTGFGPRDFVPRAVYGHYLATMWDQVVTGSDKPITVTHLQGVAVSLRGGSRRAGSRRAGSHRAGSHRATVTLDDGTVLAGNHVVVATGVPPTGPGRFGINGDVASHRYVADPWSAGSTLWAPDGAAVKPPADLTVGSPGRHAVVVGTGLTAVDVSLSLTAAGWNVTAVSPDGAFPHRHTNSSADTVVTIVDPPCEPVASTVTHWVRTSCQGLGDWRPALDAVRNRIAGVWQSMTWEHRERLMRHSAAVWQRHRHRIAPEVASELDALIAAGSLTFAAGWVRSVEPGPSVDIPVVVTATSTRAGDPTEGIRLDAGLVVNCAGPPPLAGFGQPDGRHHSVLSDLVGSGLATVDPLGVGLVVDPQGRLVAADGAVNPHVMVLGALRRGVELEATAIPELRHQATVAADIIAAERSANAS